jgi:hypothetical protein
MAAERAGRATRTFKSGSMRPHTFRLSMSPLISAAVR